VHRRTFRKLSLKLSLTLALACVSIGLAYAHHSIAEFDYSKNVAIEGIVKEVQWTNPHSYIQILVDSAEGKQDQWGIEIGSPSLNIRKGWRKDSVKRGDKVIMEIAPARNGKQYGTLRILTLPDGRKLEGVAAAFKADTNGNPSIP
jgi:Family of unknown function (DUF6152)